MDLPPLFIAILVMFVILIDLGIYILIRHYKWAKSQPRYFNKKFFLRFALLIISSLLVGAAVFFLFYQTMNWIHASGFFFYIVPRILIVSESGVEILFILALFITHLIGVKKVKK